MKPRFATISCGVGLAAITIAVLFPGSELLAEVSEPYRGPGGGGGGLPIPLLILCLPFALLIGLYFLALAIAFLPAIIVLVGASYLNDYNGWGYWWCVLALSPVGFVVGALMHAFAWAFEEARKGLSRWYYRLRN